MIAVTPSISRSSRWMRSSSSRWCTVMPDSSARALVLLGLVGDDHHLLHALGDHALLDLHDAVAFGPLAHLLAAGHRHRVVVEQLVGDVHARGDALPDGQRAAVEVGAVAQVGEDVLVVGERRLADPGHAFAAHLREGGGAAVHPHRHVVAADAGGGARAFGHARAGVVRAAAAEPGDAVAGFALHLGELAFARGDRWPAARPCAPRCRRRRPASSAAWRWPWR